jgi:hypothetical protein
MIDFTNFRDHPSKALVEIFYYYQIEAANFMESQLIANGISYERFEEIDENKKTPVYYFLVSKRQHQAVKYLNNVTIGKFRKPFIPNKLLRIMVIVLGLGSFALAILGYLKTT